MRKAKLKDREQIFWTTITIAFVLIIHNGTEPVFLLAYSLIPILILLFYKNKSLMPLVVFLIIFGFLGRYTRYFRQNYASDVLLATKDYIGLFLNGESVYNKLIWAHSGQTPFAYLPFSLFWYLPARLLTIDLRFFEMIISALVPFQVFLYGYITKRWNVLPVLAVVALTPFLLDLSADGSNDNSAISILLFSILLFVLSLKRKSNKLAIASAVVTGFAFSFKHYAGFYAMFFIPFIWKNKNLIQFNNKKYLLILTATIAVINIPFIIAAPVGFLKSSFFIEIGNYRNAWGWNIWVMLENLLDLEFTRDQKWFVRTVATITTITVFFKYFKLKSLREVFIASSTTMLVYLILSNWTTYAYFSFLIPLFGLSALEKKPD